MSFNDAPTLSITFYIYNMLSNHDSCGILIKNGNSTNATHHQHRMQQTMHNGNKQQITFKSFIWLNLFSHVA